MFGSYHNMIRLSSIKRRGPHSQKTDKNLRECVQKASKTLASLFHLLKYERSQWPLNELNNVSNIESISSFFVFQLTEKWQRLERISKDISVFLYMNFQREGLQSEYKITITLLWTQKIAVLTFFSSQGHRKSWPVKFRTYLIFWLKLFCVGK